MGMQTRSWSRMEQETVDQALKQLNGVDQQLPRRPLRVIPHAPPRRNCNDPQNQEPARAPQVWQLTEEALRHMTDEVSARAVDRVVANYAVKQKTRVASPASHASSHPRTRTQGQLERNDNGHHLPPRGNRLSQLEELDDQPQKYRRDDLRADRPQAHMREEFDGPRPKH